MFVCNCTHFIVYCLICLFSIYLTECEEGSFGNECSETCSCEEANTKTCNSIDGTCECKPGWMMPNCTEDIDECNDTSLYNCTENSMCQNINGSYECQCNDGFRKASSGECLGIVCFMFLLIDC